MNDVPNSQPPEGGADRPRLAPRPLLRPSVDPSAASAFGRPSGVGGAFSPRQAGGRPNFGELSAAPPAPEALSSAFGRPEGSGDLLQRPPGSDGEASNGVDPWDSDAAHDPWRDPAAGAVIGPPAVDRKDKDTDDFGSGKGAAKAKPAGELLSLPEVLFGRRVKVHALVLLAVIALVIGAGGGVAGWVLSDQTEELTADVALAQANPGKERPAGSVAAIAEEVRPTVVSVESRIGEGGGFGSGAVIREEGYIVTNDHVVSLPGADTKDTKYSVVFNDGSRVDASLVGTDPKTDLAVLKVDVDNLTAIQLGKSSDLAVGDTVLAIGSPLGQVDTVTSGIVSALNRPVVGGEEDGTPAAYDGIQTDAAINHGNSGGPLVDSTGTLVGINTSIIATSAEGGNIGLGFAIPIDDAIRVIEQLIQTGRASHADLGVNAASVSAETAEGARVQNVVEGKAADQAGIVQNDVILKVGDRDIADAAELIVAVRKYDIGQQVPVVLARDGRELTVQVTLQSD